MKVTEKQLEDLFELNALDQLIATKLNQIRQLQANSRATELHDQLTAAGQALLDASKREEALALDLQRNTVDLELVEQRRIRDEQRLNEAKNPKDVAGLQAEIATLKRRQAELEEVSLDLMERQQVVQDEIRQLTQNRELIRSDSAEVSAQVEGEMVKLQSSIELDRQHRERLSQLLTAELLALYAAKSQKGIAVGRLSGPQCGACQMTIASAEYSRLIAKPIDELIECPECSAILVRS